MTGWPAVLQSTLAYAFYGAGLIFCCIGIAALFRFKRFSTRLLACSATDTVGLSLLLVGGMVQRGWEPATLKMGLMLLVCLLIHPLVTMELARCQQEQDE
jgi:multicomponent Na+:H+ antiporter subunit G